MKRCRVMLIIQMILMYLAQIPFYVALILIRLIDVETYIGIGLILSGFILTALILPYCLACAIIAILTLIRGGDNPGKTTMVVKFALIPWYFFNFILCDLLLLGFLNPFLLIFAPLAIILFVSMTYLIMLSTSIFDIAYGINKIGKREYKINKFIVFTYIFLFTFCLDVIGAIMFKCKFKDETKSIQTE